MTVFFQDYPSHYDPRLDPMLQHSHTGTLSPTGCYCCPGVDPRGVAIVPTVDMRLDHRAQAMYRDFDFSGDFGGAFTSKTSFYDDGDYFLSLSKDRRTFKPIPVSEL